MPNGTKREAVFEVDEVDESELRDRLAAGIPAWADGYVDSARAAMLRNPVHWREREGDLWADRPDA